jgi:hypothetical protein
MLRLVPGKHAANRLVNRTLRNHSEILKKTRPQELLDRPIMLSDVAELRVNCWNQIYGINTAISFVSSILQNVFHKLNGHFCLILVASRTGLVSAVSNDTLIQINVSLMDFRQSLNLRSLCSEYASYICSDMCISSSIYIVTLEE